MRILFVCSAGEFPEIGSGHFARVYTIIGYLVKEFTKKHKIEIGLIGCLEQKYQEMLMSLGVSFYGVSQPIVQSIEIEAVCEENSYDIIIVDNLNFGSAIDFTKLKIEPIVIALDNLLENKSIDLNISSTLLSSSNLATENYVLFPNSDIDINGNHERDINGYQIFCSFGGYDSNNFGIQIIEYLIKNNQKNDLFWVFCVSDDKKLIQHFRERLPKNIYITKGELDFLDRLMKSDIAVVSGGLTMFQSLYAGVPSIVVPQYQHQLDNALNLKRISDLRVIDVNNGILDCDAVLENIKSLISNPAQLNELSLKARASVPENSIEILSKLFLVYELLEWDSNFFEIPIAQIHLTQLTQKVIDYVFRRARVDKVKCIYYLDSGRSYKSLQTAFRNGFNLVDSRLTFEKRIFNKPHNRIEPDFRIGQIKDLEQLINLSDKSFEQSRYFFDPNFSKEKCQQFYIEWVTKSLYGRLDDIVVVCEKENKILGFLTLKFNRNFASIGLISVHQENRKAGIGTGLLGYMENLVFEKRIPLVRVVTQGRNLDAQKLFVRNGYSPSKTEYWLHYWESTNAQT